MSCRDELEASQIHSTVIGPGLSRLWRPGAPGWAGVVWMLVAAHGAIAESVVGADRAQAPEIQQGLAIFRAADARESGFVDLEVDLRMILRNKAGGEVERDLQLRQLENLAGGDKLLLVFLTPKAIRGTALLSHAQLTREDDQWLYLPALKRVKKIASRNRSGPFLGSEFSYEDLTSQEVDKYSYRLLGEAPCQVVLAATAPGTPTLASPAVASDAAAPQCSLVERRVGPALYSGYLRQVFWIDSEYRVQKIDYYNRGDRLSKTLEATEFALFEQRFWKAQRMLMFNHITSKSTELLWHNFRFANGLSAERDFSTTSLRRAR